MFRSMQLWLYVLFSIIGQIMLKNGITFSSCWSLLSMKLSSSLVSYFLLFIIIRKNQRLLIIIFQSLSFNELHPFLADWKKCYPETMVLKLSLAVSIICNLLNLLKIQLLHVAPLKITFLRILFFTSSLT